LANVNGCEDVRGWIHSISNHLYWSASTSSTGEEMVAKWVSVVNHVQNVHTHDDYGFPACLHEPLTDADQRNWLKPSWYFLLTISVGVRHPGTYFQGWMLHSHFLG